MTPFILKAVKKFIPQDIRPGDFLLTLRDLFQKLITPQGVFPCLSPEYCRQRAVFMASGEMHGRSNQEIAVYRALYLNSRSSGLKEQGQRSSSLHKRWAR